MRRPGTAPRTRHGLRHRPAGSRATGWPTGLVLLAAGLAIANVASAANEGAAKDLADDSGCFKCHGVDKKKDGPALRDVAAKYRGASDAEEKLIFHITSGEKVKFPDGHEEHHKKVKSKDDAEIHNLVRWILALEGGTKR